MHPLFGVGIALFSSCIAAARHDASLPAARVIQELGHHRRRLTLDAENTPLYPGYGTHFSYIYVGTPPKRQSVIIDTGSHYTAFPCTGCDQCGQHTDPYFDPAASSTALIPSCGSSSRCSISQSYTEGSSWQAYKVIDKLYVGGLTSDLVQNAAEYTVDFMFGCQTRETGLFRTQLADGIMGMSMDPATLMPQLKSRKITSTSTFALCFRVGGGVMTLGGVDQSLHMTDVSYAKLMTSSGWFTVRVLDIYLQPRGEESAGAKVSLGPGSSSRGYIVDSGTTDTYLPSSLRSAFVAAFKQLSGVSYSNNAISLTEKELAKLPDVYITIEGRDGTPISVPFPWGSYIDNNGNGKYTFRIYLTENSGGVLGANFMNNKNVIFDAENGRVGFAESQCKYEEVNTRPTAAPTPEPTLASTEPCEITAYSYCDAKCEGDHSTPYLSSAGYQEYRDTCSGLRSKKECHVLCSATNSVIRGDSESCVNSFWSECSSKCKQSRVVSRLTDEGKCSISSESRSCYSDECAMQEGDFMLLLDVRWMYKPAILQWSDVYEEDLFEAFAAVLQVPAGAMDLLVDSNAEHSVSLKLQVQIRIAKNQFDTVAAFNKRAQEVLAIVKNQNFGEAALTELIAISSRLDTNAQLERYSWLRHLDEPLSVLHAVLLPYGQPRDPTPETNNGAHHSDTFVYFIIGIALAAVVSLACLTCAYCRLKQIHDDITKDKPFSLLPSRSVKDMWNRFRNRRSVGNKNYKPVQTSDISSDNNLDDDDNGFL